MTSELKKDVWESETSKEVESFIAVTHTSLVFGTSVRIKERERERIHNVI